MTWAALAPERQLPVFCLCFCLRLYPCDSIFLLPAFPIAALQGLLTMCHSKNAVTNDSRLFVVICGYLWFRSLLYSRGNFGSPLLAGDCSGLCYAPLKHVGKVCTERHKHIVTKILSQSQKMLSRHIFLALNVQDLFSFRFCTDAIPINVRQERVV